MCDDNCHWTLAEDTHIMVVFTLSSRAHSLSVFPVLPMVLFVLQIGSLLFFLAEASLLKKINSNWFEVWGFDRWSKEFKLDPVWLNDIKNQCLWIRCFTGSAKFDSPPLMALLAIVSVGRNDWKLRWYQTDLTDSWYCLWTASYQACLISRARWILQYWILQLPNAQFDLQCLFGVIIFAHFWASQAGFLFRNNT